MATRQWVLIAGAVALGAALGAAGHRWYELLPHNHGVKTAIRDLKGAALSDYGREPLSLLQSWHVETAEKIAFIDPANSPWVVQFGRSHWAKADNVNFFYILSAIRHDPRLAINIAADCHPRLALADFRENNAVYRHVIVTVTFTGAVPTLTTLATFARTEFNPALQPRIDGNKLIVRMPTHPVMVDESTPLKTDAESLDQRGQIAHFHTLLALELYAWHKQVALGDFLDTHYIVASDHNSYRNHQAINATASRIEAALSATGATKR